jgi:protein tyrosine kinase modulator
LQTRIQTARIEMSELSSRRADLYNRLNQYAYNPQLEAKYGPLARERDLLQQEYEGLRDKYSQATLSKSVESEDKGTLLLLLDPARTPKSPIEPNRMALMLLGLALGLGAAFSYATLMDMMDVTVRGSRDIETLLHQTPIAMIPIIDSPGDIIQLRRKRILISLLALTAIVVVVVVAG